MASDASVDALIGLFNRYWIDKMMARQMERARGAGAPLSLLFVDVDLFKPVTVSIGAAQMARDATPERLVESADRALYRAKRAGRDRVDG